MQFAFTQHFMKVPKWWKKFLWYSFSFFRAYCVCTASLHAELSLSLCNYIKWIWVLHICLQAVCYSLTPIHYCTTSMISYFSSRHNIAVQKQKHIRDLPFISLPTNLIKYSMKLVPMNFFNMQYFEKGHFFPQESKKFFFVFHGGWKP